MMTAVTARQFSPYATERLRRYEQIRGYVFQRNILQQVCFLGQQRLVSVACPWRPTAEKPALNLKYLFLIQSAAYARSLDRRHEKVLGVVATYAVNNAVAHRLERYHRRHVAHKAPRREQQVAL